MSIEIESNIRTDVLDPSTIENIKDTYNSFSQLNLLNNLNSFNHDLREKSFQSNKDIVDYCFLTSLGYDVVLRNEGSNFRDNLRYDEQVDVHARFWQANTVDEVLEVIKREELGEEKQFSSSLLNHINHPITQWDESNIHREVLSYAVLYNLDRGRGLIRGNTPYRKAKEVVDIGLPASHALEIVLNN
jgi:hypothetical protein